MPVVPWRWRPRTPPLFRRWCRIATRDADRRPTVRSWSRTLAERTAGGRGGGAATSHVGGQRAADDRAVRVLDACGERHLCRGQLAVGRVEPDVRLAVPASDPGTELHRIRYDLDSLGER